MPTFEPHPRFYALLKNAGMVFGGNVLSSIIGLLYLAVLTRAITLEQFGLYSLYGAFVELISRLTSFQTWQGLIHYGSHAKEADDKQLLMNLLLLGWLLDILAGSAGFCIAVGCAIWIPGLFGLSIEDHMPAIVAAAILLFNWNSVPTAFLRIYDRFVPQVIYQNIAAIFQLVSVCVLWWLGETRLVVYLTVTSVNNIIGQLCFFGYAIYLVHQDGIFDAHGINLRSLPSKCPGIWRYVTITNVDGVVRVARDMDIFIVNALLDVRAAGLYKIARTLTSAMGKVTGPFYQTIYPELARMVAARNVGSMVQLMKQAGFTLGAITAVIWVGFGILGPVFLKLAFGADYAEAYPVAFWCMGAMVVWGLAQPLSPAMMAMRRPGQSLVVHLVTTAAYVGALYLAVPVYGLLGAGVSMFLFYVLWSTIMLVVVSRQIESNS